VQKYASLTDRFVIGGRRIKDVVVDETLLKINGENYWL
jgi:transposase-like protein